MNPHAMFAPMGGLAAVTSIVLLAIPVRRFAAVRRGQVTADDFRMGESIAVPPNAALANRNYMNLLEVPTLFYAVCLMFVVAGNGTAWALGLAWSYVALRAVHSAIHLSYNNVIHRLSAFAFSNGVLTALWVLFFLSPHGRPGP